MGLKLIEKLMKHMDNSTLTKLEVEEDGVRICMEKNSFNQTVISQPAQVYTEVANSNPVTNSCEKQQEKDNVENKEVADVHQYVKSPMVGTFYAAPGPEKPTYVKVGDVIEKGQTICIIESMKLMNEIESDVEGTVTAVLVSDGNMVEYGQKLFEVLPR